VARDRYFAFLFFTFCHFVFIDKVPRVCKNDNNSIFINKPFYNFCVLALLIILKRKDCK